MKLNEMSLDGTYNTSGELQDHILICLMRLISHAQSDYEHSIESGYKSQAKDDKARKRNLEKALKIIQSNFK